MIYVSFRSTMFFSISFDWNTFKEIKYKLFWIKQNKNCTKDSFNNKKIIDLEHLIRLKCIKSQIHI